MSDGGWGMGDVGWRMWDVGLRIADCGFGGWEFLCLLWWGVNSTSWGSDACDRLVAVDAPAAVERSDTTLPSHFLATTAGLTPGGGFLLGGGSLLGEGEIECGVER
jgi:hypothetical protein